MIKELKKNWDNFIHIVYYFIFVLFNPFIPINNNHNKDEIYLFSRNIRN